MLKRTTLIAGLVLSAIGFSNAPVKALNHTGNLFVSETYDGSITEITPNGTKSTFASGLGSPLGLAFDGQTNSSAVPEPSNLLAVFGGLVSLGSLRKLKNKRRK